MSVLKIQEAFFAPYPKQEPEVLFMKSRGFSHYGYGERCEQGVGLCDTHLLNRTHMKNSYATVSCAAIILDEMEAGNLSIAVSTPSSPVPFVYGEVRRTGRNTVFFTCQEGKIQYREGNDNRMHIPRRSIPIVVLAVSTDDEVRKYFDALKTSTGEWDASYEKTLMFLDSLYYDFAKQQRYQEFEETDDLVIETIQAAYKAGSLVDVSEKFGGTKCSIFENLESGAEVEEEKKQQDLAEWDDYKAGRHVLPIMWEPEQMSQIASLSKLDDFIPTEEFFDVIHHVEGKLKKAQDAIDMGCFDADAMKKYACNLMLFGDPGTGKSEIAHAMGAALGLPVYITKFTEDTEEGSITGMEKLVGGQFQNVETEFLKGWENGGIILLEEINLARSNLTTGVFNQAFEYPYVIMKNEYEKVQRNPLTVVISTMNLGTEGTTPLNSSLSQRFVKKYEVFQPSEDAFKAILRKGGFDDQPIDCVYDVYQNIREELMSSSRTSKYVREISIRQVKGALELLEDGSSLEKAVSRTFYSALKVKSREVADSIKASCIDTMKGLESYKKKKKK